MIDFQPQNSLEEKLLEVQSGKLHPGTFFQFLQSSQAVMLLDKSLPASGVWDNTINPLILNSPHGFPVLALFSSPERATPFTKDFPAHQFALQVDIRWLLRGVPPDVGIAMNPNSSVGFELPPIGVADLKRDMGLPCPPAA